MADYALTGKKGTGKSKHAVLIIREYLAADRGIATNLDLELLPMFGPMSRKTYIRIPDKPTAFDLATIGHGNLDSYDEDKNGGLFLDELGTWLNTRDFQDAGRGKVLDWLAHGRKLGWDCFYIMQSVDQIDKQLRVSFIEFTWRHVRFDKVRVPMIGGIIQALFGQKAGFFPRFHSASCRMGTDPQGFKAQSRTFVGKDVEKCYDTRQVFRDDYPHGAFSALSPWHLVGRHQAEPEKTWLMCLLDGLRGRSVRPKPRAWGSHPSPGLRRVLALSKRLGGDQAVATVARYARFEQARGMSAL